MRFRTSPAALLFAAVALPAVTRANLVTGFEAPTYTAGTTIVGQQGWTDNDAANGPHTLFNVSTSGAKTGSRALAIADGAYRPPGAQYDYGPQLFSPSTGTGTAGTTTRFDINISGVTPAAGFPPSGADHRVFLEATPADVDPLYGPNNYVAGIDFQPNGNIQVQTSYSDPFFGDYLSFTDTGVSWTPNVYHSISIVVDPATTTLKYFYDGTLLATATALYGTAVNNVLFLNDSFVVPGELETIDNLSVTAVPEPAAIGVAAVAGLVGLRRRRVG